MHDIEGNIPGSFRDPSGSLFRREGVLYRRVNPIYREHYDLLISSHLYEELTQAGLLIPHQEVESALVGDAAVYKVLQPEVIPFISYPYEWSFSQLKDAALLTLQIQLRALQHGMSLKDASAYNIQFRGTTPVFIDTLSFEPYHEGQPWVAYRQFCQHFLAPLALMSTRDVRLSQLLRSNIDGIPLDLASKLLPFGTHLNFALATHIHGHARFQQRFADAGSAPVRRPQMSLFSLQALVNHLEMTIKSLRWNPGQTTWSDYYDATNYTEAAFVRKKQLVSEYLAAVNPATVWDLGANTGVFSRLAAAHGSYCISADFDEAAVEANYRKCVTDSECHLLPLVLDLLNPSPAIGWENTERASFIERGPADMAFALALVHHLAIANNLPFAHIARFFARICTSLIVEFVPKEDSQVKRLLASREDIFPNYTQAEFEHVFSTCFTIQASTPIAESKRMLYLLQRK